MIGIVSKEHAEAYRFCDYYIGNIIPNIVSSSLLYSVSHEEAERAVAEDALSEDAYFASWRHASKSLLNEVTSKRRA